MANRALPILYINLGGEMMYILNQRLKAQSVDDEKSTRVILEIVKTMFNEAFVEEIFKPQPIFPAAAIRSIFERVAHASIMRINASSMDKLYDLMTMVFKYQALMCSTPKELLSVTLNHLDGISELVTGFGEIKQLVERVFDKLMQIHAVTLITNDWYWIRVAILTFLQDIHVRVSILLKTGVQENNGRFKMPTCGPVACGVEVVGSIRYFEESSGEEFKKENFDSQTHFQPFSERVGCRRGTMLGTNIYKLCPTDSEPPPRSALSTVTTKTTFRPLNRILGTFQAPDQTTDQSLLEPDARATSTANIESLLKMFKVSASDSNPQDDFKTHLLALEIEQDEVEDVEDVEEVESKTKVENLNLANSLQEWSECCKAAAIEPEADPDAQDDLLSLMDEASAKQ